MRVQFRFCGICGSDLSKFEGRRSISYPESLGHEFVGEILAVGDGVDHLEPGDVVTSDLNFRCGRCDQCRLGRSHLCRDNQVGLFTNRAFSQIGDFHVDYLLAIEGPPAAHLALAEPLSCVLHAKEWAAPRPGERILVLGAGGLGSCMAFALSQEDPKLEFSITDLASRRLSSVASAVGPKGAALVEPQGEYDVVFDLSGSESGLRTATERVKPGGRLCTMSHLDGYATADFLLGALTRRDVAFKVSYLNGEPRNLVRATRLLQRHWQPAWDALIEIVPLGELSAAFANRRDSDWCKTIVEITA